MMVTLKSNVFFSQFDEGVVFRGSETPVIFRGKHVYDLVRAIVSHMERGATRDGVLAEMPEGVRPVAERLIEGLAAQGLLRTRDSADETPEIDLAPRFGSLWNYLADHSDTPGRTLERWRATTFFLEGTPPARMYVARALAECAARRILVAAADDEAEHERVREARIMDQLRREYDGLQFERIDAGSNGHAPLSQVIKIRAATDGGASGRTELEDAWFFGVLAGHPLVAFVHGKLREVLPRWERAMRPVPVEIREARLSELRLGVGASTLAFGMFKAFCAISDGPDFRGPHLIDATYGVTPVSFPAQARFIAAEADERDVALMNDRDRLTALEVLFDPITGILERVEDERTQIPLSLAAVRLRDPQFDDRSSVIVGWGENADDARMRAIGRAIEVYASKPAATLGSEVSVHVGRSLEEARGGAAARLCGFDGAAAACDASSSARVRKMAKLFSLLTGRNADVVVSSSAHGTAARVMLDGREVACGYHADADGAVYEALGDACSWVQMGSPAREATPCRAAVGAGSMRYHSLDLGYAGIDGSLYGCAAEPAL